MSVDDGVVLSVVIPHLNQETSLGVCLRSLAEQRGGTSRFEIVVVDNGSERLPTELCRRFPGVRLECETTPGPGPARNRGAAVAKGSILAFIDADCFADPGWVAAIEREFAGDPEARILGGDIQIAISDPGKPTLLEAYESVFAYRQQLYIAKREFSGTGNLAVRHDDLERVGPFAGIHVAEDLDWGKRAHAMGYRIRYVPEMVVFHPARSSFAEVYVKWDRQIAHAYQRFRGSLWGRLQWMTYAAAVLVSPVYEWARILRSPRLHSARERSLAWVGVVRVRLYRAWQMAALLLGRDSARMSEAWNRRPDSPDDT